MNKDLTGQVNRLQLAIFLLTTNLSWWLMKQKNALTVSTVSRFLKFNFLEWTQRLKEYFLLKPVFVLFACLVVRQLAEKTEAL